MSDKKKIIVTQKKSPIGRQSYQKKTLIFYLIGSDGGILQGLFYLISFVCF